jgi:hypothetical protein
MKSVARPNDDPIWRSFETYGSDDREGTARFFTEDAGLPLP